MLTCGGFLLLGGRLADLLGRRRVFVAGLVLFAGASLAGGLSGSQAQRIVARAFQGLGGALLAPAALSILTTIFPPGPERNKALGVWRAVAGSGGAAGVLLGGIITDALGWEWRHGIHHRRDRARRCSHSRHSAASRRPDAARTHRGAAARLRVGVHIVSHVIVNHGRAGTEHMPGTHGDERGHSRRVRPGRRGRRDGHADQRLGAVLG